MRFWEKLYFLTTRLLAVILVLVLCLGLVAYWLVSRSLPDYQEDYTFAGVRGEVTIIRDKYAVPHIFAGTDGDAYFALGFVHAQDRLWQMALMRRTAQGRLAELFGKRMVGSDILMRRFDFYHLAERAVSVQTPETISALKAYSAGVNAWIKKVHEGGHGRGAPEFYLLSGGLSLWRPADSLAIGKMMSLEALEPLWGEVLRTKLLLAVGEKRMRDLTSAFGKGGGATTWASAPNRTAQGKVLLASDTHNRLASPSKFYLARIGFEKNAVIGATIPGMPMLFIGRSDRHGWGVSSTGLDDIDIVMEQLNPENKSEYLSPSGYRRFKQKRSVIAVKGAPSQEVLLQWSENGPILPLAECLYNLCEVTPQGHVPALSWTAFAEPDTTLSGFIGLIHARNVEEMISVGEYIVAPSWDFILADREKIAFQMVGRIPKRGQGHQSQGKIPAIGTFAENLWEGFFPYASNPRVTRSEGGILGNVDTKMVEASSLRPLSRAQGQKMRGARWEKLVNERVFHSRESFMEMQNDTVSSAARLLLPLVARNLWYSDIDRGSNQPETLRKDALELLADWTGEMNMHSPEPLIYMAWMFNLQKRLIQDELGDFAEAFSGYAPGFIERVFSDIEGASVWCDIVQTERRESCDEIARIALDEALVGLRGRMEGAALEDWYWGGVHRATHKNETFGQAGFLRWAFNIVHPLSGGDDTLLNAMAAGEGENPFLNVHGSQFKTVYDFSDPDSSVYILSTGQSGHPFSPHYEDLNVFWRRGEYIPMSTNPALARAGAIGLTRLSPLADF